MKPLTDEQLKAIGTLKELAGIDFRAIYFSKTYVELPKEWFMATFNPAESVKQLFIDNPDRDELHVMRAGWNGMTFESVLNSQDYERWIKQWEGQASES